MEAGEISFIKILKDRLQTLKDKGNWEEAVQTANTIVKKADQLYDENDTNSITLLFECLELQANLLVDCGYLEEARQIYLDALNLINDKEILIDSVAGAYARIGLLYDIAEEGDEAITFYKEAIKLYLSLDDTSCYTKVADIYNNLAFIYRKRNDLETAEKLFLNCIDIGYKVYGSNHEKTATYYNNLGLVYLLQEKIDQAKEIHTIALESRRKIFTDDHIDVGQSYANLALVHAKLKDFTNAEKHFKRATSIYERNIRDCMQEYATMIENYVEFLEIQDRMQEAKELSNHAQKRLDKVQKTN